MNDNADQDYEGNRIVDPEWEYWRRVPAPLRNTMLGHYLASRHSRWLVALFSYGLAYTAILVTILAVFLNMDDVGHAMAILKQSAWVITGACGLFTVGGLASGRLHIAIGTGVAFLLFLFFHVLRG